MYCPLKTYLTLVDQTVKEIEIIYPPGQRDRAWLLCQQILPRLQRLEESLGDRL